MTLTDRLKKLEQPEIESGLSIAIISAGEEPPKDCNIVVIDSFGPVEPGDASSKEGDQCH